MNLVGLATLGFGSVVAGLLAVATGFWLASQLAEERRRRRRRGRRAGRAGRPRWGRSA